MTERVDANEDGEDDGGQSVKDAQSLRSDLKWTKDLLLKMKRIESNLGSDGVWTLRQMNRVAESSVRL